MVSLITGLTLEWKKGKIRFVSTLAEETQFDFDEKRDVSLKLFLSGRSYCEGGKITSYHLRGLT